MYSRLQTEQIKPPRIQHHNGQLLQATPQKQPCQVLRTPSRPQQQQIQDLMISETGVATQANTGKQPDPDLTFEQPNYTPRRPGGVKTPGAINLFLHAVIACSP